MIRSVALSALLLAAIAGSCDAPEQPQRRQPEAAAFTNRIEAPPPVVTNLGITFASVERGRLTEVRAVSGELVIPEDQDWIIRATVAGRLTWLAPQWSVLEPQGRVASLAAPEFLATQQAVLLARREAQDFGAAAERTRGRLGDADAHFAAAAELEAAHQTRLSEWLEVQEDRNPLTASEILGARRAAVEAGRTVLDAAILRDDLRKKLAAHLRAVTSAQQRATAAEARLRVMAGGTEAVLEPGRANSGGASRATVTIAAPGPGVVVEVLAAPGAYVERGDSLARVCSFDLLEFRGFVPEGDADVLTAGSRMRIQYTSRGLEPTVTTLLDHSRMADPQTRMLLVSADVPNPDGRLASGMSARAFVQIGESAVPEVLVPLACVVQDGLETIVFKRDEADPDVLIRTPVELGRRSGGQAEVLAGLLEGDSVVRDGVHQLKHAGLAKPPEGGHFHADGTWHADHE